MTQLFNLTLSRLNVQQGSTNIDSLKSNRVALLAVVIILMAKYNVNIISIKRLLVIQRLQEFDLISMPANKGSKAEKKRRVENREENA